MMRSYLVQLDICLKTVPKQTQKPKFPAPWQDCFFTDGFYRTQREKWGAVLCFHDWMYVSGP